MILKRFVFEMIQKISNSTLALQKQVVCNQIIFNTLEGTFVRSSTRSIRDAIVALDVDRIKPAGRIDRVYAPGISPNEFKEMLECKFNTNVNIIEAGNREEGSKSSKFSTFRFEVGGKEESIVLAKGIIAGGEGERRQEVCIDTQIKETNGITLEITDDEGRKHSIENITGFLKVEGNKKADFVFSNTGKSSIYVQHKSPAHQQMSGTSRFNREEYPELDNFIKKVERAVKDSVTGRLDKPMFEPIKSERLKKLAIYGSQDNTPDGVQIYAVGDLGLEGQGKVKKLVANRLYVYDEIPEGEDAPVFGATYRLDRNQYGIPNVRFGIYPASYFKGVKS